MVGAPHHVQKALDVGVDIICAQGNEAGGHTGEVATFPLIPQCVDICRGKKNYFGTQIPVVGAGGIYDGRGLAACLSLGASGVWVGTRFIATPEAATPRIHKEKVINAKSSDTMRTVIYTGRPCRVLKSPYVDGWEEGKPKEMKELLDSGVVPFNSDIKAEKAKFYMFVNDILGQAAGGVNEEVPAKQVVEDMMREAIAALQENKTQIKIGAAPATYAARAATARL